MRVIGLAIVLLAFWLLLSGHYTSWLIGAGVVTAIVVAYLGRRFGYADEEGFPLDRFLAGLLYWPWLLVEIAKSSLVVTRIILDPKLPISPTLIKGPCGPKTAVGIATYANSITLTPGTITVDVDRRRGELMVHALTYEGAKGVLEGEMNRRVSRFEGKG